TTRLRCAPARPMRVRRPLFALTAPPHPCGHCIIGTDGEAESRGKKVTGTLQAPVTFASGYGADLPPLLPTPPLHCPTPERAPAAGRRAGRQSQDRGGPPGRPAT